MTIRGGRFTGPYTPIYNCSNCSVIFTDPERFGSVNECYVDNYDPDNEENNNRLIEEKENKEKQKNEK